MKSILMSVYFFLTDKKQPYTAILFFTASSFFAHSDDSDEICKHCIPCSPFIKLIIRTDLLFLAWKNIHLIKSLWVKHRML